MSGRDSLDGVPVVVDEAQPVNVGPTRPATNMVAERGHIDIPAPEAPELDRAPQAHPGNPFSNVDIKSMLREAIQEELKGISDVPSFLGKLGKGPATEASSSDPWHKASGGVEDGPVGGGFWYEGR